MRGALHPELQPRGCVCPHDGVPAGVTAGTRRASPRANQGLQSGCCGDGSKGSGRGRGDPGEEVRAHTVCARWRWAHVCWGAQRNESCVRPGAPGWRSGGAAPVAPESRAVLSGFHSCCFFRMHPPHGTWATSCGIRERMRGMRFSHSLIKLTEQKGRETASN